MDFMELWIIFIFQGIEISIILFDFMELMDKKQFINQFVTISIDSIKSIVSKQSIKSIACKDLFFFLAIHGGHLSIQSMPYTLRGTLRQKQMTERRKNIKFALESIYSTKRIESALINLQWLRLVFGKFPSWRLTNFSSSHNGDLKYQRPSHGR